MQLLHKYCFQHTAYGSRDTATSYKPKLNIFNLLTFYRQRRIVHVCNWTYVKNIQKYIIFSTVVNPVQTY